MRGVVVRYALAGAVALGGTAFLLRFQRTHVLRGTQWIVFYGVATLVGVLVG